MDYQDFLLISQTIKSNSETSDGSFSLNNSFIDEEIGKFRVISARKHVNISSKEYSRFKYKHICFISEELSSKLSIVNEAYYIVSTSDQNINSKIKGLTPNKHDNDYLVKFKSIPVIEEIKKSTDLILLPDLLMYDLGLAKNSLCNIRKSGLYIDDTILENIIDNKEFPIKIAKRVIFTVMKNQFSKFVTPEILYNLLIEEKISIFHRSQTLILNFYNIINDEFYKKMPPGTKVKFMKLLSLKKYLNPDNFIFMLQVKEIELGDKETQSELYPNLFIFHKKYSVVTLDSFAINSFNPMKKIEISTTYTNEFLRGLQNTSYFERSIKILDNMIKKLMMKNSGSKNCNIIALSYPKGFGMSLWLKLLSSKYGMNFFQRKIRECFSTQQVEKSCYKALELRPAVLLIKGVSLLQNILNQKAGLHKTNTIANYLNKFCSSIHQSASSLGDNYPVFIFLADSAKEKISDIFAQTHDSFDYYYDFDSLNNQENSEIMKTLLTWFSITIDDLESLSNASKGMGWKKIFDLINHSDGLKDPKNLKTSLEKLRKESSSLTTVNVPDVTWKDIGGLIEAKSEITDTIMLPQMYPELFQNKIKPRTGILFFGPPGTGKTLLAKAIANECKMNFISVKGPELLNMYIGESEKNVRDLFNRARANLPCIIFFDELDALVPARGTGSDSNSVMDRIVAQFLTEIDGLGKENGLFVIGATNRPDLLDKSLLRPGRFDKMIYLGINSDKESRIKIIQAQTRKFNLSEDVDFDGLEDKIPKNFTGADFYALTSGAILKSVHRKISEIEDNFAKVKEDSNFLKSFEEWTQELSEEEKRITVSMKDFLDSLSEITPSVSEKELEKYKELKAKYSVSA